MENNWHNFLFISWSLLRSSILFESHPCQLSSLLHYSSERLLKDDGMGGWRHMLCIHLYTDEMSKWKFPSIGADDDDDDIEMLMLHN